MKRPQPEPSTDWIKADAWWRREVGDGVANVTVCRSGGTWTWVVGTARGVLKSGGGCLSAEAAKVDADTYLVCTYGITV